jgi:UDP-N-acetylglucosamine 4-epimerase
MLCNQKTLRNLAGSNQTWMITGVAGFIGSNLLEALLRLDQSVIGLDNFLTGHKRNLEDVECLVGKDRWKKFKFVEGDIRNLDICREVCVGVDFVLHQAALGSVPRSLENPLDTNSVNVDGFLNVLVAARECGVKRFVYAASSSTYGDHPELPKIENQIGRPLSPYAVTKYVNELYAEVFSRSYGVQQIGLRYFNVFGPRQDKDGAYAAVIPKWINAMINNKPVYINGDGQNSRDFCYIDNVVQANLLAATTSNSNAINEVFNIAYGEKTTLNQLYKYLNESLISTYSHLAKSKPLKRDFLSGDILHSLADISKAKGLLNYKPTHSLREGLKIAIPWYVNHL